MKKEYFEAVVRKLENRSYREAMEDILVHMSGLAEEAGDTEMVRDFDEVQSILFDIPNIDWKKAEEKGEWVVR